MHGLCQLYHQTGDTTDSVVTPLKLFTIVPIVILLGSQTVSVVAEASIPPPAMVRPATQLLLTTHGC